MIKTKTDREAAQRWEADGPSTSWGELFQKGWQAFINTDEAWRCLQTYRRTHRQRDSDTEPWWRSASSLSRDRKWKRRPMATRPKSSSLIRWWAARALLPCLLLITPFYISFLTVALKLYVLHVAGLPPACPPGWLHLHGHGQQRDFDNIYRHLVGNKTCHCCDGFLCASALNAGSVQVITVCKRVAPFCIGPCRGLQAESNLTI